ncbi:phage holin family protein [Undibacterium rugosum]|uniref:Phage holin family protein n=1 Tax=Undibacterium rugosum TaxID=2762291 RepID=A0A923HZL2_9BURK|nr:phage holin family protein [Undibacterium rugosum]MBC3935108.1 phage holin family protein [Undibacterium rugosum]MBR7780043.1 phage holin family protein [Undibacterium rugosum]
MAVLDSIRQLTATFADMLQTRLALASVEVEEELQRFSSMLLWSLAALFCACFATMLAALLLIAVFWETHRVALISGMILFFVTGAVGIALRVRQQLSQRPRFLSATLGELDKDVQGLQVPTSATTQE